MSRHSPPVPPANRSTKGPGGASKAKQRDAAKAGKRHVPENLEEQGRQGNIKQNTTNQGYQQDR